MAGGTPDQTFQCNMGTRPDSSADLLACSLSIPLLGIEEECVTMLCICANLPM